MRTFGCFGWMPAFAGMTNWLALGCGQKPALNYYGRIEVAFGLRKQTGPEHPTRFDPQRKLCDPLHFVIALFNKLGYYPIY